MATLQPMPDYSYAPNKLANNCVWKAESLNYTHAYVKHCFVETKTTKTNMKRKRKLCSSSQWDKESFTSCSQNLLVH